jgi:uncharacterized membrane protein YeiB
MVQAHSVQAAWQLTQDDSQVPAGIREARRATFRRRLAAQRGVPAHRRELTMTEQAEVDDDGACDRSPGHPGDNAAPARERVLGVDAARGLALLGMFAVHVTETLRSDSTPSHTQQFVAGHALATFVLLAGVSLAFTTRRRPAAAGSRWPDRGTAAALATRGVLIGVLGLVLNLTDPPAEVILPYYGAMFVLAIPLVRLASRTLVMLTAALVVMAPLVVLGSFGLDLPDGEPTLTSLVHPFTVVAPLLVSGSYPAVEYMAFLCAGLVLGRLDLASLRVAARIAGVGAALGLTAWLASGVLLLRLGGLAGLRDAAPSGLTAEQARNVILWDPDTTQTWWWLAERAPYTVTPLRMLHDLGVAMAVLGCCLVLARILKGPRLLWPLVAAGSMTLTLYSAHILVLATGLLEDHPVLLYVAMVLGALGFATVWRQTKDQGPLEKRLSQYGRRARERAERGPSGRQ